jgi:hypothetical protein
MPAYKLSLVRVSRSIFASLLLCLLAVTVPLTVYAQTGGLANRSWQVVNSALGATTDYTLSFTISNNITLGSLNILLCSNTPLQDDSCDLPTGVDLSNAQLSAQSGITDFTLFPVASDSVLLSRTPSAVTAPLTASVTLHNVLNPSLIGSYYVRVSAYSSSNGTGTAVAYGGLAFPVTNNLAISSVVPPYLTFCAGIAIPAFNCASASGDYINFGELSTAHSSQATSQLLVATNAPNGYVMQVYGTTMTSGNDVISAITNGAGSQAGHAQFGLNLRANSVPPIGADPTGPGTGQAAGNYNNPNHYQFVSNDVIASSLEADNFRRYTVSYLVNTPSSQSPGVYASTLTYVAAGSF